MAIEKRVAVVMGSGGDLGCIICRVLAENGKQIVMGDINPTKTKQCADTLTNLGFQPLVIIGNITQKTDVERMRMEVDKEFGRVDILVNTQGALHNELLLKLTDEAWRSTLAAHLEGTLNSMLVFAPMMKKREYGSNC
jgi:NADP-dependent 3-hydroxy acid dehydrogenase YdfG